MCLYEKYASRAENIGIHTFTHTSQYAHMCSKQISHSNGSSLGTRSFAHKSNLNGSTSHQTHGSGYPVPLQVANIFLLGSLLGWAASPRCISLESFSFNSSALEDHQSEQCNSSGALSGYRTIIPIIPTNIGYLIGYLLDTSWILVIPNWDISFDYFNGSQELMFRGWCCCWSPGCVLVRSLGPGASMSALACAAKFRSAWEAWRCRDICHGRETIRKKT